MKRLKKSADHVLYVPAAPEELSPILEIVPLQLLAYHIAVRRGLRRRSTEESGKVSPPVE